MDQKTPTAYAGDFQKVKKARILDDYTFRVTYDKPFAPALISWAAAMMPAHLLAGKDRQPASEHSGVVTKGEVVRSEHEVTQRLE